MSSADANNDDSKYIFRSARSPSLMLLPPPPQPVSKDVVIESLLSDNDLMVELFRRFVKHNPQFIKETLNEAYTANAEEITFKKLDKVTAKKEIRNFIVQNPGCLTSDIIERLELEPLFVMEILKELKNEDSVQSQTIEQQ